jgi:hypothetical protein
VTGTVTIPVHFTRSRSARVPSAGVTTATVWAADQTVTDSMNSAKATPASFRRRQPYTAIAVEITVAPANAITNGDAYDTSIALLV